MEQVGQSFFLVLMCKVNNWWIVGTVCLWTSCSFLCKTLLTDDTFNKLNNNVEQANKEATRYWPNLRNQKWTFTIGFWGTSAPRIPSRSLGVLLLGYCWEEQKYSAREKEALLGSERDKCSPWFAWREERRTRNFFLHSTADALGVWNICTENPDNCRVKK